MSRDPIEAEAAALAAALATAWPGRAPGLDAADWSLPNEAAAYVVHRRLAARLEWQPSGRPHYWKSGGASRTATLAHAPLAPDGVRQAGADAALAWPELCVAGIALGVEAEIALRLARDVAPAEATALTQETARGLVDAMAVAAEFVGSRWRQGQDAPALLRFADCQSHRALALGPWLPLRPDHGWADQPCALQINGEPPLEGRGGHSLADPCWVLPDWLRHATRDGATVPAGSVVTTGAWRVRQGLRPGDRIAVRYDGIGALELRL